MNALVVPRTPWLLPERIEGPRLETGLRRLALTALARSSRPAVQRGLRGLPEAIARERLLRPLAICRVLPLRFDGARRVAIGARTIEAEAVERLAGATEVALVFATLGPAWSTAVRDRFARGDAVGAVLLDEIGTAVLERLARRVEALVRLAARRGGRQAGSPLQPGNPDLPLAEQFVLAELADARAAGIEVTRTGMLVPSKSVSMLIGIGRQLRRWTQAQTCRECPSWERCRGRARQYTDACA